MRSTPVGGEPVGHVTRFPDTVELVRVHLEERLGIPAGVRLPVSWPTGGFLELDRTGGPRDRLSEYVQIDLAVWHPRSLATAERLVGEAVSEVLALAGGRLEGWQVLDTGNPGGVTANPDPRYPDTYRATAMIGLRVRGVSE